MTIQLDIAALKAAAGEKVFARGEAYAERGQVEIFGLDERRVLGRAFGTEVYRIELIRRAKGFAGRCTCPAYAEFQVCKHMVGLALITAAADDNELEDARQRLTGFLTYANGLSKDELVEWMLSAVLSDPERFDQIMDEIEGFG